MALWVPCSAQAQWNVTVVEGTFQNLFPVSAAMRQWGPTDEAFIVYDRVYDDDNSFDDAHDLHVEHYLCSGSGCSTGTFQQRTTLGEETRFDAVMQPSLAVHRDGTDPVELNIVFRQKLELDCDNDNTSYLQLTVNDYQTDEARAHDLLEVVWDTTNEVVDENQVELTPYQECRDYGVSYTRWYEGAPWACYTEKPDLDQATDTVLCSTNSNGGDWERDATLDNDGLNLDHSWFDMRDDDKKFVAGRWGRNGGSLDELQVHMPDHTGDPVMEFDALVEDVDYPTVDVNGDGDVRVVWQDLDRNDADSDTLQFSWCSASEDCADGSDWLTGELIQSQGQHTINDANDVMVDDLESLSHPQLVTHGDKQFLLFQADQEDGSGVQYRVYLTERCGNGAWGAPEKLYEPATASDDLLIEYGRPNIALNKNDLILHVAMVKVNNHLRGSLEEGTVYWARREYTTTCP
jgi:hypothetical protein